MERKELKRRPRKKLGRNSMEKRKIGNTRRPKVEMR